MTLIVENKNITQSFIPYLKKRMLGYLTIILNIKKLNVFDEYFESDMFGNETNIKIDSKRVVLMGMTNLSHKRYETYTQIFINPNIVYPGTQFRVVDLCKVINYGTLSIEGYPIFTETFDYFSQNIDKYKEKCAIGLG
jgi:hypothetical protein